MKLLTSKLTVFLFSAVSFALASVTAQSAVLNVTNTQDAGADSLRAAVAIAAPVRPCPDAPARQLHCDCGGRE